MKLVYPKGTIEILGTEDQGQIFIKIDSLLEKYKPDCQHLRVESVKRQYSNREGVVLQCQKCGNITKTLCKKDIENFNMLPLFNDDLVLRWRAEWDFYREISREIQQKAQNAYIAEKARAKAVRDAEWWDKYNQYLQTESWKRIRAAVFLRSGGVCEGCRQKSATQVHHLTYEHVGEEFLFELVAVCNVCHNRLHEDKPRP